MRIHVGSSVRSQRPARLLHRRVRTGSAPEITVADPLEATPTRGSERRPPSRRAVSTCCQCLIRHPTTRSEHIRSRWALCSCVRPYRGSRRDRARPIPPAIPTISGQSTRPARPIPRRSRPSRGSRRDRLSRFRRRSRPSRGSQRDRLGRFRRRSRPSRGSRRDRLSRFRRRSNAATRARYPMIAAPRGQVRPRSARGATP
jgi:hypothetical protein